MGCKLISKQTFNIGNNFAFVQNTFAYITIHLSNFQLVSTSRRYLCAGASRNSRKQQTQVSRDVERNSEPHRMQQLTGLV